MWKERYGAHGALLLGNLLFGLNYSYSKSLFVEMTPLSLAMIRVVAASVLFLLVSGATGQRRVERRDLPKLLVASLLGLVANQFVFLQGLQFTSPVDASIITTVVPVLVLLISALFIGERITLFKTAGILVGAAGALLAILYDGLGTLGQGRLGGNLLILTASTCYAGYLVWVKPLMEKYHPILIMTYVFVMGTILTLPFFGRSLLAVDFGSLEPGAWGALVFVLLGPTFLAYLFIGSGLKRVRPTTVSIYQYIQPVVAALLAVWRGQDSLSLAKVGAAALVFLGVFMVTESQKLDRIFRRTE